MPTMLTSPKLMRSMTFCSYVLSHYNCDFYEESVHSDLVDKIEEFKRLIRGIQPRNPFKVNTKPLQLVQFMYLMQKPEDATTGHVMKLLRAIRSATLFITNRNGQFCGDILTNPKVGTSTFLDTLMYRVSSFLIRT